jgi:hypothetical protein
MECSIPARLMFIGMWNFADDAGRLTCSAKSLKAQIFPSDDLSIDQVQRLIDELSSNDLIYIYTIDNKRFIQITGWHHQKIDRPKPSKIPKPSSIDRRSIAPDLSVREGIVAEVPPPNGGGANKPALVEVAADQKAPDARVYQRGREVLGKNSGGVITKLIKAKSGNLALAMAEIEKASTKNNPAEHIGWIIKSAANEERQDPVVWRDML